MDLAEIKNRMASDDLFVDDRHVNWLIAEVERLTADLVGEKNSHAITCRALELMTQELRQILNVPDDQMLVDVARELTAERDRYKAALEKHGRHGQWCHGKDFEDDMKHCDCGLSEALGQKRAEAVQPENKCGWCDKPIPASATHCSQRCWSMEQDPADHV